MSKLRLIAAALLALSVAALISPPARAEMLERDECKALQAEKQTLLTASVKAALNGGPDWVKEHLHNEAEIEQVRKYLQVEEKVAFRCRTDGVRIPKPRPPPLPDRKPEVPTYVVEVDGKAPQIIAGVAAMSFLPLRKPSLAELETAEAEVSEEEGAGDIDDAAETADVAATAQTTEAEPGPSQTVADSDKTAPPENKATQ